jgi:flavin-dependent dehydrogenase
MKVIIIGSSVAGAAAAYLLAKDAEVIVYEKKSRKDVGKKVCANVYTFMIKDILKEFNLNYRKFVKTRYTGFKAISKNNSASFKTDEYEFDRQKILENLVKNAEKKGAKFFFNTEFIDFKKNNKFIVSLKKAKKRFADYSDILIGADGAVSEVAKKSGLWQNRRFFLALQANVLAKQIKNKKFIPGKNRYNILLGDDFGYYSYIFSSKKAFVIGLEDRPEKNVREKFLKMLKFLGIKKVKISGALIPEPKVIRLKPGIFLIGDAGCQVKFTGGGVIPAFMAARAAKDAILKNDWESYRKLNSRIRLNRLAVRFFERMNDKRADKIIEIVKDRRFKDLPKNRDYLNKRHFKSIIGSKLIFSLIANLFS